MHKRHYKLFGGLLLILGVVSFIISGINLKHDAMWFTAFMTSIVTSYLGVNLIDNNL